MDVKHIKFLLDDLSKDVTLYSELFAPQESVDALNEFNGFVFGRLQLCLSERMFMAFARLMDFSETRIRGGISENLSLQNLIQRCQLEKDPVISKQYEKIEAIYKSTNIKGYRNKNLGHNDKSVKLGYTNSEVNITPNQAHDLLSLMMVLVVDISFRINEPVSNQNIESNNVAAKGNSSAFLNSLKSYNNSSKKDTLTHISS